MNAHHCLGGGGVIVGGELVDEVVAAPGGEELGAVVEAGRVCGIHDLRRSVVWMAAGWGSLLSFTGACQAAGREKQPKGSRAENGWSQFEQNQTHQLSCTPFRALRVVNCAL